MKTTIKDIARIANVSHVTVSKALNNAPGVNRDTRERILEIAKELNYTPNIAAKRLANKKLDAIGLIWPKTEGFFFYHLCNSIQQEAFKRDINTMISTADPDVSLRAFNDHFIETVIAWLEPEGWTSSEFTRERKLFQGELLVIGGGYIDNSHRISINRIKGIHLAVKHLSELGHKKIAFFGVQSEKIVGYLQGILEYKLQYNPSYLMNNIDEKNESSIEVFDKLIMGKDKPTAFIAGSHGEMITLVNLLRKHQIKIPEDFSLVVYDNIPEVQNILDVSVTTVGPSLKQLASEAISILFDKLPDDQDNRYIKKEIIPELIIRDSTRCPSC